MYNVYNKKKGNKSNIACQGMMVFAYVTTDWFIFLVLWFCHKQRKQIVSFKARLIERTYCHLPEEKNIKKSPIEIEKLKKNWIKMILNPKRK